MIRAVEHARRLAGHPYRWPARGASGFTASRLMRWAWEH